MRRDDGTIDVLAAAARLGMPVVRDDGHGLVAIGPGTATGHTTTHAPGLRRTAGETQGG